MMQRHFHEELGRLKRKLLRMARLVERAIGKAVQAFLDRDADLAQCVIHEENAINGLEIEIDDLGRSLTALWQPMAVDLRLVTTILKINTDLERMGDHAVNIAERTLHLLHPPYLDRELPFMEMALTVQQMLRDALKAFGSGDTELAQDILKRDDEVDRFNDKIGTRLGDMMEANPARIQAGIHLMMISHNLERIADLANNIAEDVIYLKLGREVRHRMLLKS